MTTPPQQTSSKLLQRVQVQDANAWQRLVTLYTPLVRYWAGQWGVVGADADDLCQEVFQGVATGVGEFRLDRSAGTFRGWLRGITRNKLVDYFRRRDRQAEAQGGTDAQRQLQQVAEQPWPEDSEADLGALYRRALELVHGEFEPQTWEAFWRVTVEGHSPAYVAADLGVTAAAVRKAKSRVLHRLRQEVGDLAD